MENDMRSKAKEYILNCENKVNMERNIYLEKKREFEDAEAQLRFKRIEFNHQHNYWRQAKKDLVVAKGRLSSLNSRIRKWNKNHPDKVMEFIEK